MSNTPLNLTRNQLAEFLPNARAVRTFEQIIKQLNDVLPASIDELYQLIGEAYFEGTSASASSAEAYALLTSLAQSLSLLTTAPARQQDGFLATDYIDLNPNAPAPADKVGRLRWGSVGTLEILMGGGNIVQQVGEELFIYGKASTAINDSPLQIIYQTGVVGASGVVTFAPTVAGITDGNVILGVATEPLALNAFGRVTVVGAVRGITTNGTAYGEVWADGDVIWYNPVTGNPTKVKPVAPNIKVKVGTIIKAGAGGSGSLQVELNTGSVLGGDDSNVQFGALANGQLIQYDAAAGYWKNVALSLIAEPPITAGTTAQYWRGDKTWQDLATQIRATVLTGLSTATNAVITAADTVLSALGKLQAQVSNKLDLTSGGNVTGNVLITSGAAALGYGTGSGDAVTQLTSKATAVILNKPTGQVTMNDAALAAGASVQFIITNSLVAATDLVIIATNDPASYSIRASAAGGAIYCILKNETGSSASVAVVVNFATIKGAIA